MKEFRRIKIPTQRIILHENPHADEYAGLIILRHWGKKMFPGVETARIEFSALGGTLQTKNLPADTVSIGTGGGPFDEHGKKDGKKECAATLVAKYLGVSEYSGLVKILAQTLREDKHASTHRNEIPSIIDFLYADGNSFEQILEWYETVFWAEFYQQEKEFRALPENFVPTTLETGYKLVKQHYSEEKANAWKGMADKAIAKTQELFKDAVDEWKANGKAFWWNNVRIGFITTDSSSMNKAARYNGVHVLVQKNSWGNVQIFADKRRGIDLTETTKLIRINEIRKKGWATVTDTKSLSMRGTHPKVHIWHLLEDAPIMLFNGSLTAQAVEPTALTLDEIVEIVKKTIGRPTRKGLVQVQTALQAA